jgi:hypothetical protein
MTPEGMTTMPMWAMMGVHICETLVAVETAAGAGLMAGAAVAETTPPFPVSIFLYFALNYMKPRLPGLSFMYIYLNIYI